MTIRVAAYGLLCIFTACSVPTNGDLATTPTAPSAWAETDGTPPSSRTDAAAPVFGGSGVRDSGVGNSRIGGYLAAPIPGLTLPPQDQNYAPAALFAKEHGDFMLAREPWRPDIQASVMGMSDVEVSGERGDFNLFHARADIQRRIFLSDPESVITVGAQFGQRDYDFKSAVPNGTHDDTLYRASASVNYARFVNDDLLVEAEFVPGVWSDMTGTLTHSDWQFFGKGLATWRVSKDMFLSGGVEHSGLFRNFDVYPLLGFAWVPDSQWRIDVMLPRQARVTFNPSEHSAVFVSFDLEGGEYNIETPLGRKRSVNVQEFTASLGGEHRFNSHLSVTGEFGMIMGGDYTYRSDGTQVYDGQLEAQMFAQVGLGWSF